MKTFVKWEPTCQFVPKIVHAVYGTAAVLAKPMMFPRNDVEAKTERIRMNIRASILVLLIMFATGCGRKSAIGFHLPDGDVEKGKAAFVALKCYSCHTVAGVETLPAAVTKHKPVAIGGEVARIKTYGELVTSVIDPSHRLSAQAKKDWEVDGKLSPMPNFNRDMTVEQMIDLVAFLQSRYSQLVPLYTYAY